MQNQVNTVGDSRESLELLYEISKELAAALDLRTVLERVLHLSLHNVKANSGSILVLNDQGRPVESAIIHGGQVYKETTERLRSTLYDGLAGWVARNKMAALVKDTSQDERWQQRSYEKTGEMGPGSSVSAPLLARENLVGVITLSHPTPDFFDEEHLALVQAIADLAGIAVLNGRLYDESRRRAVVMSALADSAAAINASLQIDEVLQTILDQTSRALQVEAVSLALIDPETNELEFRAVAGEGSADIAGLRIKMGQGVAGWVAQEGQSVIVPEAEKDPRFYTQVDAQTGYKTRMIACAPIRAKGKIIGVLEALNSKTPFDQDVLLVLEGIGNLAGTAIDHAQLFEEVEIAHRRYLEIFEDSVDSILITKRTGEIIEANRQAQLFIGYDEETLHQISVHHFHQVDWLVLGQKFENLSDGSPIAYESLLRTKDGKEIPVEVYVRQVNIDGQERLQWLLRDIT
ncbi:MAG: GAF domain-containing protein [Anaerolineae bacterium]|nr:GAF domain-containing protein [Anaerolineae bacterium]